MDPLRKNFIGRAWESLAEGWRELLTRSAGALTHFASEGVRKKQSPEDFPSWSLLAAETWETAQSIVIRVEIPGLKKEDLVVDVHGNFLRIRGERHSMAEAQGRRYHLMERAYGNFERRLPLPHEVDADKAEVTYRDGVVAVILPKTEAVPPRRLPVSN